ncbi:protein distal antenna-like [Anoplophora glabripennis]|uniref:protein distal antenna-like n=1 Tax=Anoplophora glabripennis TaxID=217634 RepID=UPI00087492FF|nr:protein distal antenna-like [Anoplophora glabripennis]
MSARAGKRPMRSLTAHEKLDAIRRVHDGESKASVARDIGVPESTLRGWCKNEDKISYLSRQSSPDTDESLESQSKKARLDDPSMQPFNLSLKSNSGTFSPNSETRYGVPECTKNEPDPSKAPLNLNTKTETPKSTSDHLTERERNRAELARMSVELGLNRPEMFLSNLHNTSNLADLSANINLLAHWNTLLLQQQQQKIQQVGKSKITAPADTSTHAVTSTAGLLAIVDQEKNKHLPKEQQSVNESIWYWLKNQQTKLGLNQNQLPNMPHSNGTGTSITTPSTIPTSISNNAALNGLNGVTPDQSSWFWKWYKQIAYGQQAQQFPAADKPILYQQLTKEAPQKDEKINTSASDHQNVENVLVNEEKSPNNKTINNNINNNKARSVLDNLLFNNNNNVAVNKKDSKEDEEILSQREALEHGEKFLKWLEACSDPSVTAMQIMQFKTLLNNVKTGAERKNGDLQNKTKVKRK